MKKIKIDVDASGVIASLDKMSAAVDKTDAKIIELKKDVDKTFKDADTKTYEKGIDQVAKSTVNAAKDNKKLKSSVKDLTREYRSNLKAAKSFGDVMDASKTYIKGLAKSIFTLPKGMSAASKASKVLKGAMLAIPIFFLIAAITSLVAFFKKSQDGADKLSQIFAGLSAVVTVITDRMIAFGRAIVNFKTGGLEGIKAAFVGIGEEMRKDYEIAIQLEKQFQNLEKAQALDTVRASKLRAEYERLRGLAEDTTLSTGKRIEYLKKAAAIEKENLNNQLATTKALIKTQLGIKVGDDESKYQGVLAIIGEQYKSIADKAFIVKHITGQIGIDESTFGDFEELASKVKKLYDLERESQRKSTALVTKIGSLQKEVAAKAKARHDKEIAAINELKSSYSSLYDYIRKQQDILDSADDSSRTKKIKAAQELKAAIQKSFDELKKVSIELGVDLDISQDDIDNTLAGIDAKLNKELSKLEVKPFDPLKPIWEIEPQIEISNVEKAVADVSELLSKPLSLNEWLGVSDKEGKAMRKAFDTIKESLQSIAQDYIDNQDALIEASQSKIDTLEEEVAAEQQLHDEGINNNLASKQAELEKEKEIQKQAIAEKKKMQKVQLAIDTATQLSGLITSSVNIFKSLSGIPFVGIPLAIATIGAMMGAFISSKAKALSLINARKGTVIKLNKKSHEQGGEHLLRKDGTSTGIEAEAGEAVAVFTRSASSKHYSEIKDFVTRLNAGGSPAKTKLIPIGRKEQSNINIFADLSETNKLLSEQNAILKKRKASNRNKIINAS